MTQTAVVYSCCHADPRFDNNRAEWLGSLIYDLKPDYVIDLGDTADMNSLCSHEKAALNPVTTYERDILSYHDFQEKLRHKFSRNKRKKPVWIGHEGNHENRIKRALSNDPRLEGAISFKDLETERYYNEYHEYMYGSPSISCRNRTLFAHFFTTWNYNSSMSNIHLGHALVKKTGMSTFMGHTHKRSHYMDDGLLSGPAQGVNVGCMIDYEQPWAGQANKDWWSGCAILHNWKDGQFDLEWVSIERMRDTYGG